MVAPNPYEVIKPDDPRYQEIANQERGDFDPAGGYHISSEEAAALVEALDELTK